MLNLNGIGRPLCRIDGGKYEGHVVSVSDQFKQEGEEARPPACALAEALAAGSASLDPLAEWFQAHFERLEASGQLAGQSGSWARKDRQSPYAQNNVFERQ